ncbi:MAG: DUF2478 domain-containing protein [Paracoccaceae bacterium]
MKIAVITSKIIGQTDQLISEVAAKLQSEGMRLTGVVKILDTAQTGDHHCDMDLRVLPDGPDIRISQSLGKGSSGCRLNPAGIVEAVAATELNNSAKADMFILNKFGPQESEGRGFCDAIATALENDTPVLVGVGKNCRAAFDTFMDGIAETLPPDAGAIYAWCRKAVEEA